MKDLDTCLTQLKWLKKTAQHESFAKMHKPDVEWLDTLVECVRRQIEIEHKIKTKADMCESAYMIDHLMFRDLYNDIHAHYDDAVQSVKDAVVRDVINTEVMYSHIDWSNE